MGQAQVRTLRFAKRVVAGSLGVALLTLLCYRAHVDLASAIPLYLLLVVLQSLTGDFPSSLIISALSTLCLDLFFTEPLFSLRITNPLHAFALLAFVFTALVITRLVSRVREEATSSRLQKERLDLLYQLSQQLLALEPGAEMGEVFLEPFRRHFGVAGICVFDADTAKLQAGGDSGQEMRDKTRDAYISGHDLDDPGLGLSIRCLRVGGRMTGAVGFKGLSDPGGTANSLMAVTAVFLERTKAFRRASAATAAAQTEVYRSAVLDALAHEFKTPLATILAAAGGLREAGPLGVGQLELADIVESEAARLGSLISRLLRTARLDSEEVRPQLELIDITSLVAHIASQYSAQSSDRRIVLTNRHRAVEALADPELLQLAVNQVIENACKYSQPASSVRIAIERQDDFITVKISNNGSSIPYNEQHHIFERYYRGADAKRSTSGSGLGLYVARKIALAHGGALDLEIEEWANDGVTFCLKIPSTKNESNHVVTAK